MGLHLHSPELEAWLTRGPDDVEDPLEAVEFPRERKPWKRDRHELRRLAALASKQRGPWVQDDRGWWRNLDHAQRFVEFGWAASHRYRLRVIGHLMSPYERADEKRYWRCAIVEAGKRNRVPLP